MSTQYALLSVSDKTGITDLGTALIQYGVILLSTGGTHKALRDGGVPQVTQVSAFTGAPEILDGRVKTLHPKIAACILYRRGNDKDIAEMKSAGYDDQDIDFVICNLYPFQDTVAKPDVTEEQIIENIDIGGPTMVREAAKNFASVCVIVDPTDYPALIAELEANNGKTTVGFRWRMAAKAFAHTCQYDAAIADYFERDEADGRFPKSLRVTYDRIPYHLRYGENPHQDGTALRQRGYDGITILDATVLADNKEISYNNFGDLDATLDLLLEFSGAGSSPFACLLKHTNACGAATGATLAEAYRDALATDPLSAFGCIIGLSQVVDLDVARLIHDSGFVECILAPGYTSEALALLQRKKQRRILALPRIVEGWPANQCMNRHIRGGLLRQEMNDHIVDPANLEVVTERPPTEEELQSLLFAWRVVKHLKSNAIALASGTRAVGLGMGDTSRVDAAITAVRRAGTRAQGAVMASDAFYPMPDGVEVGTNAGVTAIIQPGGSKGDQEAIDAANRAGAAMVFTNHRCFKH